MSRRLGSADLWCSVELVGLANRVTSMDNKGYKYIAFIKQVLCITYSLMGLMGNSWESGAGVSK